MAKGEIFTGLPKWAQGLIAVAIVGGAGYVGYYNNFNSGTGTAGQGFRGGYVLANNNAGGGGGAGQAGAGFKCAELRFPSLKSYIQEQKKAAALARKGNAKV